MKPYPIKRFKKWFSGVDRLNEFENEISLYYMMIKSIRNIQIQLLSEGQTQTAKEWGDVIKKINSRISRMERFFSEHHRGW